MILLIQQQVYDDTLLFTLKYYSQNLSSKPLHSEIAGPFELRLIVVPWLHVARRRYGDYGILLTIFNDHK